MPCLSMVVTPFNKPLDHILRGGRIAGSTRRPL
jgi:hypothetical protein